MRASSLIASALILTAAASLPCAAADEKGMQVISRGKSVEVSDSLAPEMSTLIVFLKSNSSVERQFLADLCRDAGAKVGIRAIELKTGTEPVAQQYEIKETPTAMVFDRRKRLLSRSSDPAAIRAALKKAAGVMRIDWAEDGDTLYEGSMKALGRPPGSGILRTMTLQPEYLKSINELSMKAHFSEGYLPRRVKEMIATYVSQLNRCKY